MRSIASICVVAAGLAACTSAQQVSSSPPTVSYNPPTVSYRVSGNDLSEANAQAASYCQRYGGTARLQSAGGGQANYQCVGATTAVAPAPAVVAPASPVVAAPPAAVPTVSYPVIGTDVSSANISAANYCRQYGRTAQLNGVSSGTAFYNCI